MLYVHFVRGTAPVLRARAQISVDGVRWMDLGKAFEPIREPGGYHLTLGSFGNWLRLVGEVSKEGRKTTAPPWKSISTGY